MTNCKNCGGVRGPNDATCTYCGTVLFTDNNKDLAVFDKIMRNEIMSANEMRSAMGIPTVTTDPAYMETDNSGHYSRWY